MGKLVANKFQPQNGYRFFLNKAIWIVYLFWNCFLSTKVYKRFFAPSTFLFLATGMKSLKWKKRRRHIKQRSKIPQAVMQHNRATPTPSFQFFSQAVLLKKSENFQSVGWWKEVCFVCCILGSVFFGRGKIGYFSVISPKPNMSFTCP